MLAVGSVGAAAESPGARCEAAAWASGRGGAGAGPACVSALRPAWGVSACPWVRPPRRNCVAREEPAAVLDTRRLRDAGAPGPRRSWHSGGSPGPPPASVTTATGQGLCPKPARAPRSSPDAPSPRAMRKRSRPCPLGRVQIVFGSGRHSHCSYRPCVMGYGNAGPRCEANCDHDKPRRRPGAAEHSRTPVTPPPTPPPWPGLRGVRALRDPPALQTCDGTMCGRRPCRPGRVLRRVGSERPRPAGAAGLQTRPRGAQGRAPLRLGALRPAHVRA